MNEPKEYRKNFNPRIRKRIRLQGVKKMNVILYRYITTIPPI